LRLFWFVARRLSVENASRLGHWVIRRIGPRLHRHRHIRRNLSLALRNRGPDEIEALSRGVWGSFGEVLAQYVHLPEICGSEIDQRIELVTHRGLDIFAAEPRPVVFVGAHLANWELLAASVAARGVPLTVVYNPEPNPLVARMMQKRRRSLGCGFISKGDGLRPLMRELSQGRSIGLLIDRRNDRGEVLPFFGLGTPMTLSPARLALKFGCQLVPAQVETLGPARFRVTTYPAVEPDDRSASEPEQALQMMLKVHAYFEDWIEQRPQEWFCSKRMWPKRLAAGEPEALERR
jgi:KDO2-lipid IV(A) lauroyltransferase